MQDASENTDSFVVDRMKFFINQYRKKNFLGENKKQDAKEQAK
jgi:hypothetical protein